MANCVALRHFFFQKNYITWGGIVIVRSMYFELSGNLYYIITNHSSLPMGMTAAPVTLIS